MSTGRENSIVRWGIVAEMARIRTARTVRSREVTTQIDSYWNPCVKGSTYLTTALTQLHFIQSQHRTYITTD